MKPFEERHTLWIDGQLSGVELEAFERELAERPEAELDRAQAEGLGRLLREHSAPAMQNADFFSHQLLQRIAEETPTPRAAAAPRREWSLFGLPNLAWAGACCLLLSGAVYFATLDPASERPPGFAADAPKGEASLPITAVHIASATPSPGEPVSVYDASIIEATAVEPGVSASVYTQAENVTVLWLDGLDYLPASYTLQ